MVIYFAFLCLQRITQINQTSPVQFQSLSNTSPQIYRENRDCLNCHHSQSNQVETCCPDWRLFQHIFQICSCPQLVPNQAPRRPQHGMSREVCYCYNHEMKQYYCYYYMIQNKCIKGKLCVTYGPRSVTYDPRSKCTAN